MSQAYEKVERFDVALEASGITEKDFIALNGLGESAIREWRRARSRQAPRWAVVQAELLAALRKYSGKPYVQAEEIAASEYIWMESVKAQRNGVDGWRMANGFWFDHTFVPDTLKLDPHFQLMTPGQQLAYWQYPSDPGTPQEFYEKWCQPTNEIKPQSTEPTEVFGGDKPMF